VWLLDFLGSSADRTDPISASRRGVSLALSDETEFRLESAPSDMIRLVEHLGNTYGLDAGDALDLYYACSGDGAVADQAARLGNVDGHLNQIPSEYVALMRKVWTFRDDQKVLSGSREERREVEEKRGRRGVAARRRFLERHVDWGRRARWPVDASAL
jgi:hypothetical protein